MDFIILLGGFFIGVVVWSQYFRPWTIGYFNEIIDEHYLSETGLVRSYGTSVNQEYLSESMSLYLLWLQNSNQLERYNVAQSDFKKHFLKQNPAGEYISWRIDEKEPSQVNALIDDRRVLENSLLDPVHTADIVESYQKNQVQDGFASDFYDFEYLEASERVVLSYGIPTFLEDPDPMKTIYEKATKQARPFFPENYLILEKKFVENETVHLIDQLLIALEMEKYGFVTTEFKRFLLSEWKEHHKLYGRYNRQSLNFEDVESASVYALASYYATEIGEKELAVRWFDEGKTLLSNTIEDTSKVHFFDLIWYAPKLNKY